MCYLNENRLIYIYRLIHKLFVKYNFNLTFYFNCLFSSHYYHILYRIKFKHHNDLIQLEFLKYYQIIIYDGFLSINYFLMNLLQKYNLISIRFQEVIF